MLLEIAKELRKTDFMPIVGVIKNLYNPHLEIAAEAKRHDLSVEIFPCNGRLDLKTIFLLRRFLKEKGISIIHTHGYKSNLYALMASLGKDISLITTCHNWLGDDPKMRFYAGLDKFFLNRFDKVIAVSEILRQETLNHNVAPRKVLTINNGINIERFKNQKKTDSIRKEFGIDKSYKVIGTVGRLSEEKGFIQLLNVAQKVFNKYPKTVFLIIGDGPLRKELQREYYSPSIIFTGIRNDVPDLYRCMDIFVLPSLAEGLPMALLEAMASKLPVVATRVGAVPTVIVDKETGLLIEPGNEESIKVSLLHLLENSTLAKSMGQNGYNYVKQHFSSENMARDYLNIYRELIEKG